MSSRDRRALAVLLAVRLAVGAVYSLVVPPWESYDETGHYQYARYIAKHRTLLKPEDPEAQAIWSNFQPPLYYLLIAPVLAAFDLRGPFQFPMLNPYLANGNAGVNYAVTPEQPRGAEAQTIAALRAGRIAGVWVSTLSVLFFFWAVQRLWRRQPHLTWTATLLYAFWPQFVFIGGMMTNDLLITSLAAVYAYIIIHLLQDGPRPALLTALALTLAAAILTKLNGFALVPAAIVVAVWVFKGRSHQAGLVLIGLGIVLIMAAGGLSSLGFVTGQIFQPATLTRLFDRLPTFANIVNANTLLYGFWTFFASYGWGNVETAAPLYWLWALGGAAAVIGAGLGWSRGRLSLGPEPVAGRVLVVSLLSVISLVGLSMLLAVAQQDVFLLVGRYWLPALPFTIILLVAGWQALLPASLSEWSWKMVGVGVVLASWYAPFGILAPIYAKPRLDTRLEIPLHVTFGSAIELRGYETPPTVRPGSDWHVTLCWQALQPMAENYPLRLEIVGIDGQGYGRLETFHGHGNYPTGLWDENAPFCETYALHISPALPAPARATLRVQVLSKPQGEPLAAANASNALEIPVKAWAAAAEPPRYSIRYTFDHQIALTGYEILPTAQGRGLDVRLGWEALTDLTADYVVFVHLRDAPAHNFAQADSQPRQGGFPTSLWEPGQVVLDTHSFTFGPSEDKPGALSLYVGLYQAATGERLSITDAAGAPVLNNEVLLAEGIHVDVPDLFRPSDFVFLPLITLQPGEPIEVTPSPVYPPLAYP